MNVPHDIFLSAYREFFERIYAIPARARGYEGWGVKEVQSGLETANFLKLLYPEAKFIFLVRHPFSCLLSIKRRNWLDETDSTYALKYYSRHWCALAKEFRQADFGFLVTYEKLLSEPVQMERLASYLGLKNLKQDFFDSSHADWAASHDEVLTYMEKRRILKIVAGEMAAYEYE